LGWVSGDLVQAPASESATDRGRRSLAAGRRVFGQLIALRAAGVLSKTGFLFHARLAPGPASAAAEWLAEFRSDIESFINREAVEACIAWDVRER